MHGKTLLAHLLAAWAVIAASATGEPDAARAPAGRPRKLLAPSSGHGQLNGGIQYHGGELMTAPLNVHLIYYGTWANYSATSGVLSGLVNSLSGSRYWAINHHYYDADGTRVSLKVRTATQLQVPYLVSPFGGAMVQMPYYDAGARQILHHVLRREASVPLSNASLYVILASGVRIDGMCTVFCGWHNAVEIAGTMVKYAVVGDVTLCPGRCVAPLLNASNAPNGDFVGDGMASVVAHEIAEAATDPHPSPFYFSFSDYDYHVRDSDYFAGWYSDAWYEENADICAWRFGRVNTTSNGKVFNVALGSSQMRFMLQQNFDPVQGGGCTLSTQRTAWSPPPPSPPAPAAPAAPSSPLAPGVCVPFVYWGFDSGDYTCSPTKSPLSVTGSAWSSITIVQQAGVSATYLEPFLYVAMSSYALPQPTLPASYVFSYTSGANTVVNTTLVHYGDGPYYGAVDRLVVECWYTYCTYYYYSMGECSYYDYWNNNYVQICGFSTSMVAEGMILGADASRTLVNVTVKLPPPAVAPVFTVLAGATVPLYADGVGSAALFNNPTAVAVSADGSYVYVADSGNRVIRTINTQTGATSTVAGTVDGYGYGYSDGYSTSFANPAGVATDLTNDDVVVVDSWACTLRRVNAYGYTSTVAGQAGYCSASVDGAGTSARFRYPTAVVVDNWGYSYVWDSSCIRVISPSVSGSALSTAASVSTLAGRPNSYTSVGADGTGTYASFAATGANSMAIDNTGNIYVAEYVFYGSIRKVTPAGVVSTLPLTGDVIYYPNGIAVTAGGALLVTGTGNEAVYSVIPPTQGSVYWSVSRVAGNGAWGFADGAALSALFYSPNGIAVFGSGSAQQAYIADSSNNLIRVYSNAQVSTLAGSRPYGFTNGAGTAAQFWGPSHVAADASGNVVVADQFNHAIRYITSSGQVTTYAGSSAGLGGYADGVGTNARFFYPCGVAFDTNGNVYASDATTIRKITKSGSVGSVATLAGSASWGYANGKGTAARFSYLAGLAVDASGTVYVADRNNNAIRKILSDGTVTTLAGSPFGSDGYADGAASAALFNYPLGVAVSGGVVFVADSSNCRIRKIAADGTVSTFAGSGCDSCYSSSFDGIGTSACFSYPVDVTVDASGTLFVVERWSRSIRKVTPDGTVTTYAGFSTPVLSGPPLSYLSGVAATSTGALVVSDEGANVVRMLQAPTQQGSLDLSYTVFASPYLLSTLPLYVSRGFSPDSPPWISDAASLEISAVDLLCTAQIGGLLPWFYNPLVQACTTSFTASSVNLTQLFAYGYSPNGASTVTFTLNVSYADGTSVLLWSASTNTLFGVSLPQRVFALNASKPVQALVFSSNSTPPGVFHLDLYAPQVLFAAGPAGPGAPSARRADGSLDNFDVAAGKRAAAAAALGALVNATGVPVSSRPHGSPAGVQPGGGRRRELQRGPDGVIRLVLPKRLKAAVENPKRGSEAGADAAPPAADAPDAHAPWRTTRSREDKPVVRQALTPEMKRGVQAPRRRHA